LVPLDGDTLAHAFEGYFQRSEQLPTTIRLAASPRLCAGMLLQQIPSAGGHALRATTPDFERLGILFATLTDEELLTLAPETILHRLFNEDDVRVQPERRLVFRCSCSRERVANVLLSLGPDEALASAAPGGTASVRCEFCGETYLFARSQIEALFTTRADAFPAGG
jgi:molecular chaperone Hsp33